MDKNNDFGEFFSSPIAAELIDSAENVIRRAVSGISASCESLRESAEKKHSKLDIHWIDGIMQNCCDLMRGAQLGRALTAARLTDDDMCTVKADSFIRDFAAGCKKASRGRCTVNVDKVCAAYIRTDKESLCFLLLSFVRRLTACGRDGKNDFVVSCGKKLKTLNITVRALGTFVDEAHIGQVDIFDSRYGEVCMGFAERIGACAELSDDTLTVSIPLSDGNSAAVTEAVTAAPERDSFDPFAVMLGNM